MWNDECGMRNEDKGRAFNSSLIISHSVFHIHRFSFGLDDSSILRLQREKSIVRGVLFVNEEGRRV